MGREFFFSDPEFHLPLFGSDAFDFSLRFYDILYVLISSHFPASSSLDFFYFSAERCLGARDSDLGFGRATDRSSPKTRDSSTENHCTMLIIR